MTMLRIDPNDLSALGPVPAKQKLKKKLISKVSIIEKEELQCCCCGSNDLIEIKKTPSLEYQQCNDCGFIFKDGNAEDRQESLLHKNESPESAAFLAPALSWLTAKELKVLEIGSKSSDVVNELRQKGHEVESMDPLGLGSNQFSPGSFDLIYAYNSFRYSSNPLGMARKLFSYLKEGGLLVIYGDVTNAYDFPYEKSTCSAFFTFNSFEAIMEKLDKTIIYKNPYMLIARKGL